ncbi:MAG: hypothetical protein AB1442_11065 [Nitrospirota bacterium]
MKVGIWKKIAGAIFFAFVAFCLLADQLCAAGKTDEGEKQPVTKYWMSVSTVNQTIPGMSEAMSSLGGMLGGMGGPGFGPRRQIHLQLNSPQKLPSEPHATHDIPPGQNMGKTLPLMIPERERAVPEPREEMPTEHKFEKPKFRMLIYWGCGENVRSGQPKVIDTEKMSPEDFGRAFSGITPSPQYPPVPREGWIYADWPNRKSTVEVPKTSSLQGDHFVHGNYAPDIRFAIGDRHDFMAPVEFSSVQGGLADSIKFQWQSIPTATGYFAMATAYNEKNGEMIIWSSSETPETTYSLMDFLPPGDVQKFIKEKIVMPPSVTSCNIPKGIFKDTSGGMLQFIAYGNELNVAYPPKPKDPNEPWNLIWTTKVRLKSTGMLFLGQTEEMGSSHRPMRERRTEEYPEDEAVAPEQRQQQQEDPRDDSSIPIKKLRGILGF